MKRGIALFLVVVMCLSTAACANSKATLEEETLNLLDEVYKYNREEMLMLLAAWEYAIDYDNADILTRMGMFDDFCERVSMTEDDIVDALTNGIGITWDTMGKVGADGTTRSEENGLDKSAIAQALASLDISFFIVRYYYMKNILHIGTIDAIDLDTQLDQVKENLKQLKETSDAYDILKDYYLVVCEINNWVDKPSGSYDNISADAKEYDRKVRSYKNELDLAIG